MDKSELSAKQRGIRSIVGKWNGNFRFSTSFPVISRPNYLPLHGPPFPQGEVGRARELCVRVFSSMGPSRVLINHVHVRARDYCNFSGLNKFELLFSPLFRSPNERSMRQVNEADFANNNFPGALSPLSGNFARNITLVE